MSLGIRLVTRTSPMHWRSTSNTYRRLRNGRRYVFRSPRRSHQLRNVVWPNWILQSTIGASDETLRQHLTTTSDETAVGRDLVHIQKVATLLAGVLCINADGILSPIQMSTLSGHFTWLFFLAQPSRSSLNHVYEFAHHLDERVRRPISSLQC